MFIELVDGTQIECIRIIGGPRKYEGEIRDTLSIEIKPGRLSLNDLIGIFKYPDNTRKLYALKNANDTSKLEIGEGYCILASGRKENRKKVTQPGKMVPVEYEDIFIINLAQLTYGEYQKFLAGEFTPPSYSTD